MQGHFKNFRLTGKVYPEKYILPTGGSILPYAIIVWDKTTFQ